ncbi:cbb3-type cytochrome oxidase assembly protein CcoS [Psychrobacter sp. F1192]|uniref:Cbb3-type cytochrome oxidase assembly protein CcoS n=1 Tax=Psychrobacter coccoides TaxID=2818440 RepID=A0ABS3NLA0_9GAMM|nr:cbb3-type cytochrome oxidase assembly protein CcoS [Psychrobacter coccoides]MBO1530186.1 cbb3-type cytochrome oxidase assembly protein CcoS [Psychrobacter coccoides]
MLSIFLLIPLSLMLFVVAIWAVRYAVKSNQFEDLDNASQRIILDDRQERRQVLQAHESRKAPEPSETLATTDHEEVSPDTSVNASDADNHKT